MMRRIVLKMNKNLKNSIKSKRRKIAKKIIRRKELKSKNNRYRSIKIEIKRS